MKNLLVVAGVHGDEVHALKVAQAYRNFNPDNQILIASPQAIKKRQRYVETDLNRSFECLYPVSYEEKLAVKLVKKISHFDFILDFHNTKAKGTTCAIVTQKPNNWQIALTSHFGLKRLVIMPKNGSLIGCFPEKSLSIEIANSDTDFFNTSFLLKKLTRLFLSRFAGQRLELYEYCTKVMESTLLKQKISLGSINNFMELDKQQKKRLGLNSKDQYFPIFAKERLSDQSFTLIRLVAVKS